VWQAIAPHPQSFRFAPARSPQSNDDLGLTVEVGPAILTMCVT